MTDYQAILSAASQLPLADRLRLIEALAASVPDDLSLDLSAEWLSEIQSRSEEIDRGQVQTVSWQDAQQDLRRRVGLDDSP